MLETHCHEKEITALQNDNFKLKQKLEKCNEMLQKQEQESNSQLVQQQKLYDEVLKQLKDIEGNFQRQCQKEQEWMEKFQNVQKEKNDLYEEYTKLQQKQQWSEERQIEIKFKYEQLQAKEKQLLKERERLEEERKKLTEERYNFEFQKQKFRCQEESLHHREIQIKKLEGEIEREKKSWQEKEELVAKMKEMQEKLKKQYQSKSLEFQEFYEDQVQFGKLLGRGSFATVYSCILKINNGLYAAKSMHMPPSATESKKQAILKQWQREIDILRNAKHENIVSLVGFLKKPEELVLIMDLYDSTLRKYLTEKYEFGDKVKWH